MCKSTDFYRNRVELNQIEPGALWQRQGKLITLVDDDQHVCIHFHPDDFTQVKPGESIPEDISS